MYDVATFPIVHSTEVKWLINDLRQGSNSPSTDCLRYEYNADAQGMICAEYECMTDACITERTGDVNPADPDENTQNFTEGERNE
jgi:hypothetical protein